MPISCCCAFRRATSSSSNITFACSNAPGAIEPSAPAVSLFVPTSAADAPGTGGRARAWTHHPSELRRTGAASDDGGSGGTGGTGGGNASGPRKNDDGAAR